MTKALNKQHIMEEMVDILLAYPMMSRSELAQRVGYSANWVSIVINSDAFQAKLAERRNELVNPVLALSLEEKYKGLVDMSLDIVAEKLAESNNPALALQALEIGNKALGLGQQKGQNLVQANFVIQVPTKSASSTEWAEAYKPS